jgi:hypothetical protein
LNFGDKDEGRSALKTWKGSKTEYGQSRGGRHHVMVVYKEKTARGSKGHISTCTSHLLNECIMLVHHHGCHYSVHATTTPEQTTRQKRYSWCCSCHRHISTDVLYSHTLMQFDLIIKKPGIHTHVLIESTLPVEQDQGMNKKKEWG